MKKLILILLMLQAFNVSSEPKGTLSKLVTEKNIRKTVCVSGYTKTVRPPVSFTNSLKIMMFKQTHLTGSVKSFELDHFVPLSLGGSPKDTDNLWLQSWDGEFGALNKDKLETQLHRDLCNNKVTLKKAQQCFLVDWKQCYTQYYSRTRGFTKP